ncbi:alanine--tRNA ligase-like [Rhinoderma darwinii]|uniref:alanine--tRNA ligase-like n=1 Tax=Rhinoderma darwinii TaxID=43563 RepID=UPI003F66AF44
MLTSVEIRRLFLDFFKSKQHHIVPSDSIVLKNDPTLMFTNAGMNQFKEYFLGNKVPQYKRIVDTQKCLRVSGKHNDLDEVGIDTYHHTMFEMLGNWSFGDYFKEEAIQWSWQLLTEVYKIDKDRIYVSIFKGDEKEKLVKDEEAQKVWEKYLPKDRILEFGKKENFWEMGEIGPCGPCSEIHIDCRNEDERKKINGKELVNKDNPLVIEIWNNVFIQYNRLKNGSLEELPQKHVDTGMGLERLVRVIQHKHSNYDTDIFTNTFQKIESITHKKYTKSQSLQDIAFRVIADHIRAVCFTISDGQIPSNTGAGYVVRRILRRAVRYYYSHLEYSTALLYQLVPLIAEQFKEVFPELYQQKDFVAKIILEEENNFLKTIALGIKRLETYIQQQHQQKEISGEIAFELYDTYGFPLDLTTVIANENGFTINVAAFNNAMKNQKDRSREATKIEAFDWKIIEQQKSSTPFIGYKNLEIKTDLLQYREIHQKGKKYYQWVLLETPFYAESGGQIGDKGALVFGEEEIKVVDTKKIDDLIVHFTETLPLTITKNVVAKVDALKRSETCLHHSTTHLLHAALKKILGNHIQQKGAFLCDEYLRFDFSHFEKINDEQLQAIETLVRQKIQQNILVQTQILPKEEAIKKGANALFGEKYGDIVRMVTIDDTFSIELCGGTHADNTSQIGNFKIIQESSVAAGIRRIEAICGTAYQQYIQKQIEELKEVKIRLQNPKDIIFTLEHLLSEKKSLLQQNENFENTIATLFSQQIIAKKETKKDIEWIVENVEVSSLNMLKKVATQVKQKLTLPYVIALISIIENKIYLTIQVEEMLAKQHSIELNIWAKKYLYPLIQGKGGGQKNNINIVGEDTKNIPKIIQTIKETIL